MKQFKPLSINPWAQLKRIVRHQCAFGWRVRRLLDAAEREAVAHAIATSEAKHTGEIAVAIEGRLSLANVMRKICARERAWQVFSKMQLWDTADNNSILIYILWAERRIEILADRGIAPLIPEAQWQGWVHELHEHAQSHDWGAGLVSVITQIDVHLSAHFPLGAGEARDNRVDNQPTIG